MGPKKDQKKDRASSATPATKNSKTKLADESINMEEANTSVVISPVQKSKVVPADDSKQQTLDKHLKVCSDPGELKDMLNNLTEKLSSLASQEYIEKKFKELITEEVLKQKLKELEKSIKLEMQKEIEKVSKEVRDVNAKVGTVESIIEELRNKVSDLETKTQSLEEKNALLVQVNEKLEHSLEEREVKIRSMDRKNNDLEQYTRRNSVRIYGVQDEKKETSNESCDKVLKLVKDKLGIKLHTSDIDIAHRIGKYRSDGYRPIICKFVQRYTKQEVLKARRKLKGSAYVIREDLTLTNAKLLEDVSAHSKVKTAWTDEGKVVALLTNDRKFLVSGLCDLDFVSVDIPVGSRISTTSVDTPVA